MRVIKGLLLYLLLLLAGSACSGQGGQPPVKAYPVDVGKVIQENVPVYMEEIGNVYSFSTINVKPQVSGILLEAHVKQGQEVKAGDLLYTIDPRYYEAQLKRAQGTLLKDIAALEFAQQRVDRFKDLVTKDYVARVTYEEYQSNVDEAKGQIVMDEADVALAQINLDYCYVKSPIDGMISVYNIYPGNYVRSDSTDALTVIRQIVPADVHFTLTQSEFDSLRISPHEGDREFEVYAPDQPERIYKGKVYFIDNNIDINTGTILFKGEVKNGDKYFWPGQFVRVRMLVEMRNDAMLVPFSAVQVGQKGEFLYVVKPDNTVELRSVKTSVRKGEYIVVENNVSPGDVVVTDGQINLHSGAAIKVRNAPKDKDKKSS